MYLVNNNITMILRHKNNTGDQNYIDTQDRIEIDTQFAWLPIWVGADFDSRHNKHYLVWLEDYLVVRDNGKRDGQYYL